MTKTFGMIRFSDLFALIILLGVIQGFYLSFFFIIKRSPNNKASWFLALLLIFMALMNFDFWAGYTLTTLRYPHLLDLSVPVSLAVGPLIYHYTRYFLFAKREKNLILHYLPVLFCLGYSIFFYFQTADFKYNTFIQSRGLDLPLRAEIRPVSPDPWGIRIYTGYVMILQLVIYLALSIKTYLTFVYQHEQRLRNVSEQGMFWLRHSLIASLIVISVAVIIQLFFPGGGAEYVLAIFITLFIYFTSFHVIRNSMFFKQGVIPEKYKKSSLDEKNRVMLVNRINDYIKNEKEYLGNLFSLKSFARAVGTSPDHLSQVLNQYFGRTFFEFLAEYRIEEARRLLSDPDKKSIKIDEIALMVGYNSKSAFNNAFKASTGQTPGCYRKELLKESTRRQEHT